MAMGQQPIVPPVNKIGSKMGCEFTYQPKWDPKTVLGNQPKDRPTWGGSRTASEGLPEKAYLSLRAGEVRLGAECWELRFGRRIVAQLFPCCIAYGHHA